MILTKLESDEQKKKATAKDLDENPELSKSYLKLDKIYLKLVDLYLETNQEAQRKHVISLIESRLEVISNS